MLGTKFEETRVYREASEEERVAIAINLLRQGFVMDAIALSTIPRNITPRNMPSDRCGTVGL
jgi:hypothetical protein